MTEKLRQESERESARPPQKWENPNEDSLRLHREALEAMPPAQRAAPAYHLRKENPLEPELAGSTEGVQLVVINPEYFDKSLPRTAVQIMAVRWSGAWVRDPNWRSTCEGQVPSIQLLHETAVKTNWGSVRSVMGK
jgi:hypothetical protein